MLFIALLSMLLLTVLLLLMSELLLLTTMREPSVVMLLIGIVGVVVEVGVMSATEGVLLVGVEMVLIVVLVES